MSARTWFLECRYSDGSTVAVLVPVARDEPFPATLERAERICREINASTIQLFNLDPWGLAEIETFSEEMLETH